MKKFASGICFDKLFIIFLIVSIIGSFYESFVDIIYSAIYDEYISYKIHTGVIYGLFNVIYGFGAVLMILLIKGNNLKVFLSGAIVGGLFEYIVSFLQETFTGSTSWDYSDKLLNINGRTGITYMIIWGLFALIFIKKVYPFLSCLIEKIPYSIGNIVIKILVVFMAIDIFISWTAIIRQNLRHNNIKPITFLGEIYDKYYTDEFMEKYFPNMNFR